MARGRCLDRRDGREAGKEERAERQQVAGKREREGGTREKEPHRREGDIEGRERRPEGGGESVAFILFEQGEASAGAGADDVCVCV